VDDPPHQDGGVVAAAGHCFLSDDQSGVDARLESPHYRNTSMKRKLTIGDILISTLLMIAGINLAQCTAPWWLPTAKAGEATLTWTPPTQNCDGTALTNLTGYKVYWGQGTNTLIAPASTYKVSGLAPGLWWFSVTAVTPTVESEFVTVTKTILANEFAVSQSDAFALVKRTDRLVLTKVGTVPIGTPCLADQTVNGKYVVPRSLVTWSGTVKPDVVVATCQ